MVIYVNSPDRRNDFTARETEFLIWAGQIYRLLLDNVEMRRRLEAELVDLRRSAAGVHLITESPAMTALLERLKKAAPTDAPILILGETGAGKECIARFIHDKSLCSKGRYVARNCAAIPAELFESEMFGYVKGGFTGADGPRKGAFREADGGTPVFG